MRIIPLVILLFMVACQSNTDTESKEPASTEQLDGADRDEHGCIGSAGYTWSAVKDSCIRVFEEGTPFVKYDAATGAIDSSTVAYVVLSEDKQRAEAFFGTTDKPILMDALPVMEGETMPVLFENKTEIVKLRSHRDTYQLLYQDTVRYVQYYNAENGIGKWLKKSP
jgi:hypothetical protein